MVKFNLASLLCLPFALTSAFVSTQTRSLVGQSQSFTLPSSGFIAKTPKQDTALSFRRKSIPDDTFQALVEDILLENGVNGVNAAEIAETIKEPIENPSWDGSLTRMGATSDGNFESMFAATTLSMSPSFMSASIQTEDSCEWASIEFAIEAVSLGLQAAGLPGGTGKRVAKILVRKAKKRLRKEMKRIVKDYFSSVNPFKNAQGLIEVFNIIIGEIGSGEFLDIVLSSVGWWDAIQISVLLTAYFISGGSGLAAKLALLTPQIIDVVEAGIEVSNAC